MRRPWAGVGIPLLIALVHIAVVAPRYHVGSFDDDAAYLLMAHGLLHGVSLGGYLAHHLPLLDAYPPGYPLLLAPLLWLFGSGSYLAERLLSALCVAGTFPLIWVWLGRRKVPEGVRVAVLALAALNPLIATYGSMVMAEAPFFIVLVGLLILADRWEVSGRAWCPAAVGTIVAAVAAVWLKQAALAFLPALVLWLAWRRRWWPAVAAAVAGVALLVPIAAGRLATGVPIAGSRYTSELGAYYAGGWLHRLALVPLGLVQWCFDALPSAIVPTGSPLNDHTAVFVVFRGLACSTTAVAVTVGAVVWVRRRGADLAVFLTLGYAAEVSLYKYVNDRRALLLLPILLPWYVTGVAYSYHWLVARSRTVVALGRWRRGMALWSVMAVAGPLSAQFPADYRFALGQSSSAPATSPYMALLRQLGKSSQVVETTYLWSTALLTHHATDNLAATETATGCDSSAVPGELRADNAAYLLTAAIDLPGQVDSPCLESAASSAPWAVPLLETPVDNATVFELIGPQSVQPDLRALLSLDTATLAAPPTPPKGKGASLSVRRVPTAWRWTLPAGNIVRQVSVGGVGAPSGTTGPVLLRLLEGGSWHTVASAPGPVGAGTNNPFLLVTLPAGTKASALELVVAAHNTVQVSDLDVLGSPAPNPRPQVARRKAGRLVAPEPTKRRPAAHSPLVAAAPPAGSRPLG